MSDSKQIAIVGGGIAGLSTAYQLLTLDPSVKVTVLERGNKESYTSTQDTTHRASLGASPARVIRLTGASPGAGISAVQETKAMLDALQADIDANPAAYEGLAGKKLHTPESAVIIAATRDDATYAKALASMQASQAAHEEISGAELKQKFPGLYEKVADTAVVLHELPASPDNPNGLSGIMDIESTLKALTTFIARKGGKVLTGQAVQSVKEDIVGVTIRTPAGEQRFDEAVLAPGQWIGGLVDMKKHDIALRHDRVIVLDVDTKALGIESASIPFTKGLAPAGGKVGMYSFRPDSTEGHAKIIPAATTRSVSSAQELRAPVTDGELSTAIYAASKALGVDPDLLRMHSTASACAYTSPKTKENPLVDKISQHITINGVDSSSTARTSGGLGKIAASHALNMPEPYQGAFEKYSIEAHQQLAATAPTVEQGSMIQRVYAALQQAIGL